MESENQRPDYVGMVDTVIQLIGEVLNRDIVHAVVEHYNGDLNQAVDTIMNMYEEKIPAVVQTNTSHTPGNQTIQPTPMNNAHTITQHMTQNIEAASTAEMANTPMSYTPLEELSSVPVNQSVDMIMTMSKEKAPAVVQTNTSCALGNQTIQPTAINNAGTISQHMTRNLGAPGSVEMANTPMSHTPLEELSSIPVNHSLDTIINMSEENAPAVVQTSTSCITGNQLTQPTLIDSADTITQHITRNLNAPSTVEMAVAHNVVPKSKGAVPKQPTKLKETNNSTCNIWTIQTKQIVDYHHQGSRTLIIMRGLHISGKTYLATQLLQTMCPNADCKTHILSTNDFFKGKYRYDGSRLSEAHTWNQNRARVAMHQGLSPIFIDNNNVEIHEMEPYVKDGLNNGYIIEVLQPNTPWTKRVNQMSQKKSLADNYQNSITGIYIIRSCGLSYSADKKPPVRRNFPPILATSPTSQLEQPMSAVSNQFSVLVPHNSTIQHNPLILSTNTPQLNQPTLTVPDQASLLIPLSSKVQKNPQILPTSQIPQMIQPIITSSDQTSALLPHNLTIQKKIETDIFQDHKEFEFNSSFATSISSSNATVPSEIKAQSRNGDKSTITPDNVEKISFIELRKQLKIIEKVDQEEDNGERWNQNSQASSSSQVKEKTLLATPLHRRGTVDTDHSPSNSNYNDGSNNSTHMQWNDYYHKVPSNTKVETATHSTSIDFGDTNMINKNLKILIGTPKDINFYYMGLNYENIPKKGMLDKSSMTYNYNHISSEMESLESSLSFESQASSDDYERTVNVDLGTVFVAELDQMFGRSDMVYPDHITTKVNMPISLLNEINALWIESLMDQLDQQSRQTELMLRQDEEFARQLALKEEQLAQAGHEPAVPDLKEVMDMELALSIYKDEITAEWRNNEPNDLAARTTKERLYNLFPDVQSETLSEVLMAHDSNFQATVEILLLSTSNAQILEEENGVAKFIAKKELERQKQILEDQKKAVAEVVWPILPKEVKVDMSTFQDYRAKASQHLAKRNLYYQKAQEFFKRDMMDIASYYSDVAVMHKNKYEQANSLAAASLMQIHAEKSDNATVDLHYLHVPEAMVSLDLFIDTHIQKLRDSKAMGGPQYHTLFFITGRGKHSPGGPRIKPAVKKRLRDRGIAFAERNPGLLTSKVCAEDKMMHQLR